MGIVKHLETLGNSGGDLIAAPVDKLVGIISGRDDPILPKVGNFAGDVLKTPFRIAGTWAWGAMKGSAKLAWAGIKNLPIFPAWKAERDAVKANAEAKLATLSKGVPPTEKKNV